MALAARAFRLTGPLLLAGCVGDIAGDSIAQVGGDVVPPPGAADARRAPDAHAPSYEERPPSPAAACAPAPRRIWRLTPAQYLRTLGAVLDTTVDGLSDLEGTLPPIEGFSNDAAPQVMSVPHASHLFSMTRKAVASAFATPGKVFPCLADRPGDAACVRGFVEAFGARAFRRPLTTAEVDGHLGNFMKNLPTQTAAVAVKTLATTMLLSPHFLFRTELGVPAGPSGVFRLDPYEKASSLSYLLTDGPPDAQLMNAARTGALETTEGVAAQARRLLASAESGRGAFKFFVEKFGLREVVGATKETRAFPMWNQAVAADMAKASELFLQELLWKGGARFSQLLGADHAYVNSRTKFLYSFLPTTAAATATFEKVTLPATRAGGLMVHPALMAVMVVDSDTGPVRRGRFVRENLLCQEVPEPDATTAAMAIQPKPDGRTTQRERLAVHSSNPFCASCHKAMDPIGLAFENFDAIGRYRTTEAKKLIDASGTLTGISQELPFTNAVDLLGKLAATPEAVECFARSALDYASGRTLTELDRCQVERVAKRFAASGGNMLDLLAAIVTDEQFFLRREETR